MTVTFNRGDIIKIPQNTQIISESRAGVSKLAKPLYGVYLGIEEMSFGELCQILVDNEIYWVASEDIYEGR